MEGGREEGRKINHVSRPLPAFELRQIDALHARGAEPFAAAVPGERAWQKNECTYLSPQQAPSTSANGWGEEILSTTATRLRLRRGFLNVFTPRDVVVVDGGGGGSEAVGQGDRPRRRFEPQRRARAVQCWLVILAVFVVAAGDAVGLHLVDRLHGWHHNNRQSK